MHIDLAASTFRHITHIRYDKIKDFFGRYYLQHDVCQ